MQQVMGTACLGVPYALAGHLTIRLSPKSIDPDSVRAIWAIREPREAGMHPDSGATLTLELASVGGLVVHGSPGDGLAAAGVIELAISGL